MDTIVILMSTYNGERFLVEQLESILIQKDVHIKLLVRDDGSNDATWDILKKYKNKYIDVFEIIKGDNVGWKASFFKLIKYAEENYKKYDYFAFADQDDIWLENKLIKGLLALNTLPDGPKLYCSNLFYYKDGINQGPIRDIQNKPSYKDVLLRNYATGCTILMNLSLIKLLSYNDKINVAHDYWAFQVAMFCGNVYFDNASYILYRQHDSNQIGYKYGFIENWKRRFRELKKSITQHSREIQAKELLYLYKNYIRDKTALHILEKFALYRTNIKTRMGLLMDSEYTCINFDSKIFLKIRILLGIL